jgi:hypothetical protein
MSKKKPTFAELAKTPAERITPKSSFLRKLEQQQSKAAKEQHIVTLMDSYRNRRT